MSWEDEVAARRITPELLAVAVPDCKAPDVWADYLDDACYHLGVNNAEEQAMLLAHLGHESQGFARLQENLNYSVEGLLATFGRHRISEADARRYGRAPGQRADQRMIANTVYGGTWGRENLGNRKGTSDGWDFRGQGLIHTTGRANYHQTQQWVRKHFGIKVNLLDAPARLTEPELACMAALCYWEERVRHRVNPTDLNATTRAVNGGLNGLDDRRNRLAVARRAFRL